MGTVVKRGIWGWKGYCWRVVVVNGIICGRSGVDEVISRVSGGAVSYRRDK